MPCEHEKLQADRSVRSDAMTIVEYVLCDRCGRMYNAFFSDINECIGGVSVERVKDYKIVPVTKHNGKFQAQLYETAKAEGGVVLSSSNMIYVTQDHATEEQAIQDAENHYQTIK
jgi:hypothetical protein